MKKERLFQVIGMIEDDWIKEAEDEQIIQKKPIPVAAAWKRTAAAAGFLLIVGIGILQKNLQQNYNNATASITGNDMETAAAGMEQSKKMEQNDGIAELEAAYERSAEPAQEKQVLETEWETGDSGNKNGNASGSSYSNIEENKDSLYDWNSGKVLLYAEIIWEIYQPYKGEILYLNLDSGWNLDEEQKENLLELLDSKYNIPVVTGSFEELCEQNIIDAEAKKITGLYLSFEVTDEEENRFAFQIDCWGGRNVRMEWQECYAIYEADGWNYQLGEENMAGKGWE